MTPRETKPRVTPALLRYRNLSEPAWACNREPRSCVSTSRMVLRMQLFHALASHVCIDLRGR